MGGTHVWGGAAPATGESMSFCMDGPQIDCLDDHT